MTTKVQAREQAAEQSPPLAPVVATLPVPAKKPNMIGKGKPGPGRPKGMQNKTTLLVKEAVAAALAEGDGAVHFFVKLKKTDPVAFAQICARLIPTELVGSGEEGAHEHVLRVIHESR